MEKIEQLRIRINELAHKDKTIGLTEEEIAERAELRKESIDEFKKGFKHNILDNLYIMDKDGNKIKAKPKKKG